MATMTARTATTRKRFDEATAVVLALVIGHATYELHPFEDETEGLSICEWKHKFVEGGKRPFYVYPVRLYDRSDDGPVRIANGPDRWRCTRCGTGDCEHVRAIVSVNLA
jgi:hypothetical protein